MIRYYYPIPLIGNAIFILQWYLLMNHTYPRRFSKTVTWAAEVGIFALFIYMGSTLPYMSVIRSFFTPVLFTVGFIILYRDRWQKIACTAVILFLLMYIVEYFVALFVYTPEEMAGHFNDSPPLRQIQVYSFTLSISGVTVWLLGLLLNR